MELIIEARLVKPDAQDLETYFNNHEGNRAELESYITDCCELYSSLSENSTVNRKMLNLKELKDDGTIILAFKSELELKTPGRALSHFTSLLLKNTGSNNYSKYYIDQMYGTKLFSYEFIDEENMVDVEKIPISDLIASLSRYLEKSKGARTTEEIKAIRRMIDLALSCGLLDAKKYQKQLPV